MGVEELSLADARRLALCSQGFDRPRPRRPDLRAVRRVVRTLGVLQLDYVNVLAPAHYTVLFSRLGPYDRGKLDELAYGRRELVEQWAHEASLVPTEHWPLLAERRRTFRLRPWGIERFLEEHAGCVDTLLEHVRRSGPVEAAELPDSESAPRRLLDERVAFFNDSSKRHVLEAFFARGRLAVAHRAPNFARAYDLAERVLPRDVLDREVPDDEARRGLLLIAARAHGVATAADLADYFRMPVRAARPALAELVDRGELLQARVEGWREPAFVHPAARPNPVRARVLLAPFDPLVWTRPRVARLFGFDYRVELFVEPAKRRHGYYVLPFLSGERLVARVDVAARREEGRLEVIGAWAEAGVVKERVAGELAAELSSMAAWLSLKRVTAGRRGDLARALAAALRR